MSKTNSNRFALYVSIGKIVAMAAQFVMPVFLTRYLSKADYGTYAQFYLVQGFVGSVLCFGIQSNPYYFYPNSSSLRQKQIIWNSFIVLLLLGIAGSSLLFVPSINNWLLKNEVLSDNLFIVIIAKTKRAEIENEMSKTSLFSLPFFSCIYWNLNNN